MFSACKTIRYVSSNVEAAVAEHLAQIDFEGQEVQPNANINEMIESAVTKAVAKVKKEMKVTSKTVTQVPAATPKTTTTKPADNRQYIDVRGPKGAVKLYVGQPKTEVLELLGTPDSYDFGGSSESCRYHQNGSLLFIDFRNNKLTEVRKY